MFRGEIKNLKNSFELKQKELSVILETSKNNSSIPRSTHSPCYETPSFNNNYLSAERLSNINKTTSKASSKGDSANIDDLNYHSEENNYLKSKNNLVKNQAENSFDSLDDENKFIKNNNQNLAGDIVVNFDENYFIYNDVKANCNSQAKDSKVNSLTEQKHKKANSIEPSINKKKFSKENICSLNQIEKLEGYFSNAWNNPLDKNQIEDQLKECLVIIKKNVSQICNLEIQLQKELSENEILKSKLYLSEISLGKNLDTMGKENSESIEGSIDQIKIIDYENKTKKDASTHKSPKSETDFENFLPSYEAAMVKQKPSPTSIKNSNDEEAEKDMKQALDKLVELELTQIKQKMNEKTIYSENETLKKEIEAIKLKNITLQRINSEIVTKLQSTSEIKNYITQAYINDVVFLEDAKETEKLSLSCEIQKHIDILENNNNQSDNKKDMLQIIECQQPPKKELSNSEELQAIIESQKSTIYELETNITYYKLQDEELRSDILKLRQQALNHTHESKNMDMELSKTHENYNKLLNNLIEEQAKSKRLEAQISGAQRLSEEIELQKDNLEKEQNLNPIVKEDLKVANSTIQGHLKQINDQKAQKSQINQDLHNLNKKYIQLERGSKKHDIEKIHFHDESKKTKELLEITRKHVDILKKDVDKREKQTEKDRSTGALLSARNSSIEKIHETNPKVNEIRNENYKLSIKNIEQKNQLKKSQKLEEKYKNEAKGLQKDQEYFNKFENNDLDPKNFFRKLDQDKKKLTKDVETRRNNNDCLNVKIKNDKKYSPEKFKDYSKDPNAPKIEVEKGIENAHWKYMKTPSCDKAYLKNPVHFEKRVPIEYTNKARDKSNNKMNYENDTQYQKNFA